jgi:acyl carrier protein
VNDINEIINSVIAEKTVLKEQVYELNDTVNLLEVGLDSFQLMNVIVELENRLDITFRDEDLIVIKFQNLKQIYASIREVLSNYGKKTVSG